MGGNRASGPDERGDAMAGEVSAVVPARAGRPDDEAVAHHRVERRFAFFGALATYAAAAIPLLDAATRPAALERGSWTVVGGLLIAFFLLYHLHFLRGPDQPTLARVALYAGVQGLIVVALQRVEPGFVGLAIALAIQVMSVLPPRFWPAPIVGLLATQAGAWDLAGVARRGNAADTALFVYQLLLWVAAFGFVIMLLRQRRRLAEVVGELRRAQDALRQAANQAEELATLRERTRLAREMHDGLGHALVTVNVKLEAAERLYRRDADRGAAELRATRDLVREAMVGLRRSLDDLRAPILSPPDLPAALRTLLAETRERTGLATVDEIDPAVTEASPEVAEACW
ncbi:MAG: histidine kinase [Chloroflexota bacterium]|nr:histidine kinase [Chloroflexota bacterium]